MFLQELNPIAQELIQQPVAFLTGFAAGAFKLNLNEDPLKSWLEKQGITNVTNNNSHNSSEPQSISID